MTYLDVQELLDFVQDHVNYARDNDNEDQVIAACTRAVLRLEQIRSEIAINGFEMEDE